MFQLRRERFIEELESYMKQVEEFQTFGEINEIQRYLKKAQTLDTKLQVAADKVLVIELFLYIFMSSSCYLETQMLTVFVLMPD